METKTVECIARVQAEDQGTFVNNLFVETRIITFQRMSPAIPENAVISEHERHYVWIRVSEEGDQMTFRKVPLRTGVSSEGFTEILEEGLTDILLEGAYNLWSEE